uniref:Ubiquitin-like domain-containing protein n=1 Tax=Poecilia mexicana TaxID=48701 RepID=A0A3B3WEG7_9TELE
MIYSVEVTGLDGQKVTIDLCDNEEAMQRITVGELKDKIKKIPGIPSKLIYFICLHFRRKMIKPVKK